MSPRFAKRAESTQDHIAKAALRLIEEHGADDVSIPDVIKAMGITRAAMARYCPADEDLWQTTAEFIEKRVADSWEAIRSNGESPAERLRALLALQIGLITSMPALREILFSRGLHGGNTALRRGLCAVRGRFRVLLTETLRDGVIGGELPPDIDPEQTARRLTEMLQGMIVSWSLDAPREDMAVEMWARLDALVHTPGQPAIAAAGGAPPNEERGS